eukprot:2429806-Heterocapsa_arctica.AAC.1
MISVLTHGGSVGIVTREDRSLIKGIAHIQSMIYMMVKMRITDTRGGGFKTMGMLRTMRMK